MRIYLQEIHRKNVMVFLSTYILNSKVTIECFPYPLRLHTQNQFGRRHLLSLSGNNLIKAKLKHLSG